MKNTLNAAESAKKAELQRKVGLAKGFDINCAFTTTVLHDGWHYHVCQKCNGRRLGPPDKPHYMRECPMWYKGLGNRIAAVLDKAGITKERWAKFTGKPCRCKERQELLNKLLPWL